MDRGTGTEEVEVDSVVCTLQDERDKIFEARLSNRGLKTLGDDCRRCQMGLESV